jgi:hypothetical protein
MSYSQFSLIRAQCSFDCRYTGLNVTSVATSLTPVDIEPRDTHLLCFITNLSKDELAYLP